MENEKQLTTLCEERRQEFIKSLAKTIDTLSFISDNFKYCCEKLDYNADACYETEDAVRKLGIVLASLIRWNDDDIDYGNNDKDNQ